MMKVTYVRPITKTSVPAGVYSQCVNGGPALYLGAATRVLIECDPAEVMIDSDGFVKLARVHPEVGIQVNDEVVAYLNGADS